MNNNNGYIKMWDNWSKRRASIPVYDNWLDEYSIILNKYKDTQILDLGCGIGADTLYLIEKGFNVLSCDFSNEALKSIKNYIPNSKTTYLNLLDHSLLTMKHFLLLSPIYLYIILMTKQLLIL